MRVVRPILVFCFCFGLWIGIVDAQETVPVKQGSQTAGMTSPSQNPGAQAPNDANSPDERYRIGYQDTLDVQVFRHSELNKRVSVDTNGTIMLFRLDAPIIAVCKTEAELAADIAKAYEKDYLRNPEVNVIAVEQKSQSVSVIGAVEKPGSFFLNRRVHLLELLAFAGGPKSGEAGTRLLVARTGSKSNCQQDASTSKDNDNIELMNFKISDVQTGRETLWMLPGDVVSVLPADVVYMYGNVNKQGSVKIKEPLTLTQAIALAEGLKGSTQKDRVRVLRQKPGSPDRDEMVYDLTLIDRGKAKDPILEPNDIVAISEDKTKSIINSIARSLTGGLPSIFYRVP